MSKKILSIVLAVVLLFSVCAVAVNAAVADGKSIGIKVVTDATTNTKAGDIVNVKVYYTVPDESQEYYLQNGPIAVAWNSEAFAPNTTSTTNTITDCRTWGDSYVNVMKTTCAVSKATSSTIISSHYAAVSDSYGWDSACRVVLTMDTAAGYTTATGFQIDPACELFTMQFVAQRDITATDVIGIPYGTYGDANLKINERIEGSTTPSLYSTDVIDWSQAAAAPSAPSYDVYKLSAPRKHSNGDGTNTVAVFFAFNSIAPDFNTAGTSQFISAIAATVTATSGDQSITVESDPIKYVYDLGEGEYGFRVILKNVPDAADITVVPSVVTDGTEYNVETVSFNVADATAA